LQIDSCAPHFVLKPAWLSLAGGRGEPQAGRWNDVLGPDDWNGLLVVD